MKIRVLGCSGATYPGHSPPGFLLDDRIVFDGGSLTSALDAKAQLKITDIFITHAHLDHVTGILFLLDNIIVSRIWHRINILGLPRTIKTIRKNLLNSSVWPDFTVIPNADNQILTLTELKADRPILIESYTITPHRVNHSVPAVGYMVEDEEQRRLFYTGDTGPSDSTWRKISGKQIEGLIIEASFPNGMERIALSTGHLTPRLLQKELLKIEPAPKKIYITHLKTQYLRTIQRELRELRLKNLTVLKDGQMIEV